MVFQPSYRTGRGCVIINKFNTNYFYMVMKKIGRSCIKNCKVCTIDIRVTSLGGG